MGEEVRLKRRRNGGRYLTTDATRLKAQFPDTRATLDPARDLDELVRLKAERAVAKAVENSGVHEWLGPARQLGASTSPIRQRCSLCYLGEILDFKNLTVKMRRFRGRCRLAQYCGAGKRPIPPLVWD